MFSTKFKLAVARIISVTLSLLVRLTGRNPHSLYVTRHGIKWRLDLNEGLDLSIALFGGFEVLSQRALAKYVPVGGTVIDVGANRGAYCLPLAQQVGPTGRVVACEATNWGVLKIEEALSLNPDLRAQTQVVHAIITSPAGVKRDSFEASWNLADRAKSTSINQGTEMPAAGATPLTLDQLVKDLALSAVDAIKIDTDGWDAYVLEGATTTLQRFKPVLLVELAPDSLEIHGNSFEKLWTLLSENGYSLYELNLTPVQRPVVHPRGGGRNILALAA